MTEHPQKVKSFEELTDIYHKYKLLSKVDNNAEEMKLEPILQYVTDMCEEVPDESTEFTLKLRTIKGSLLYDEARVLLTNQKTFAALEKLRKALQLIKPYKTNPKLTYLYFRILNQIAYFLAQNNEIDESLGLLEEAEIFYEQLENISEIFVFETEDLFQEMRPQKKRNTMKFEKLITNNFHLQGWIYNRKHMTDKFTVYYHMVLRRQLETQDSSALLWIFKCARLASHFYGNHKFAEGRYHLAAAYYVLHEYELDLLKRRSDPQFVAEWANLQKYYADLGKYWVKYGLFLFDASRRFLQNNTSDTAINDILIKSFKDPMPRKSFQSIDKSLKEKLQTIEENPEDVNQEIPGNNESEIELSNSKTKIIMNNKEVDVEHRDECKIEANSDGNDSDANIKQNAINKDVAEITESLIDLLDDHLKDEDNDRKCCVAKYISMLDNLSNTSNNQNTNNNNDDDVENKKEQNGNKVENNGGSGCKDKSNYQFVFPTLPLSDIESQVTTEMVTSLESARNLFLFTQEWVKRCKAYYCMQDFPLDYVNLILDLNDLYRYLSLYETSIDMQYDVQKRRVDLLEKLTQTLKDNRPQFYLSLNIELVNELTQAQIELILLNLRRLNCAPSPVQQKEEVYRKMEALIDIRKRLSRKESLITYCANRMVSSLSEPEIS